MYKINKSLRKKRDRIAFAVFNLTNKQMYIWLALLLISCIPIGFCYLFNSKELTNIVIYVCFFNVIVLVSMQKNKNECIWHKILCAFIFVFQPIKKHEYMNLSKFQFMLISKKYKKGGKHDWS